MVCVEVCQPSGSLVYAGLAETGRDVRIALIDIGAPSVHSSALLLGDHLLADEDRIEDYITSRGTTEHAPVTIQLVNRQCRTLGHLRALRYELWDLLRVDSDCDDDEMTIAILDIGSCTARVGFAGNEETTSIFPCVAGRYRVCGGGMIGMEVRDRCIGNEALAKRGVLILQHPLTKGIVTNFQDMQRVWHHAFYNELRIAPEEHPVFLTEPILNPKGNRELTCSIMFESFNVPALYMTTQALLALHGSGRASGLVLDCGQEECRAIPIYETGIIFHAIRCTKVGGLDLDNYMQKLLTESTVWNKSLRSDISVFTDIRNNACRVAPTRVSEFVHSVATEELNKQVRLADGAEMFIGIERFQCPEALFEPSLVGVLGDGIHRCVAQAVAEASQCQLYENILLCGGLCKLEGFHERMVTELSELVPVKDRLNLILPRRPEMAAWKGASHIASSAAFQEKWILSSHYAEHGPSIVNARGECAGL